jgi:membrane protein implicated in regulation of membrane protease activity
MKNQSTIVISSLVALSVFAIGLALFDAILIEGIALVFKLRFPNDASAGDSAGWMIVFSGPLSIGFDALVSAALAIFAYRIVERRLSSPDGARLR